LSPGGLRRPLKRRPDRARRGAAFAGMRGTGTGDSRFDAAAGAWGGRPPITAAGGLSIRPGK